MFRFIRGPCGAEGPIDPAREAPGRPASVVDGDARFMPGRAETQLRRRPRYPRSSARRLGTCAKVPRRSPLRRPRVPDAQDIAQKDHAREAVAESLDVAVLEVR